ncbi:MAG: hypothetical protein AB8B91_05515, partial [Rubripirellula sp.]
MNAESTRRKRKQSGVDHSQSKPIEKRGEAKMNRDCRPFAARLLFRIAAMTAAILISSWSQAEERPAADDQKVDGPPALS